MRNAIQRFMYGRYGNDQFGHFLIGLGLVLILLEALTGFGLLTLLADVAVFYALFRMLSRNTYKRREENAKFLKKANPAIKWLRLQQTIRKDKDHRYFKCPNCSQYLRVPRGKGKITVTCRSCGASFQEKS
ncbi:MAG: hypothetical protein IJZ52_03790 [Clostridium sp.]|nr:hypothetical protein [Clostridium sp.]